MDTNFVREVQEEYVGPEEVAAILGKTVRTLREDMRRRPSSIPPYTKIGGRVIFRKDSLKSWLILKESKPRR
jgi:hypothetical protein